MLRDNVSSTTAHKRSVCSKFREKEHVKKMDLVVDIQFCKSSENNYTPKEVAVVSLNTDSLSHWIVLPPFSIKKLQCSVRHQNNWLASNKHGLHWLDGDITEKKLVKNLQDISKLADKIYVRGEEKQKFLQGIVTNDIINLEEEPNFPSFKNLQWTDTYCIQHSLKFCYLTYTCALNNAARIKSCVLKQRQSNSDNIIISDHEQPRNITDTFSDKGSHSGSLSLGFNPETLAETNGFYFQHG